ncbi:sugar phosphate isomerase/epimerase [Mycobacterium sp. 236(2023)]|uniref:sugar phosphate isomerase/epimerase family protein n=1 Tax=Mycobacterium sp. 236(2023) TaxID=3038163 RepID=UPI0024153C8C|nr:sugar phosphate isomerase/epimerase [Mycobacterium sp. 236(2023)]MDG4668923.1 sugar phosphate isomerase/epimerase [Mycobacterium sp. 236(2023)]
MRSPSGHRPISLAPLTVLELSPPELVACAADAGFDGVGLRLIRATEEELLRPTIGSTPMIRETRQRLDDTGLFLLDIEVLRLRPDTKVRDHFGAFLETGAYLGASQILVTGNDPDHARLADNLAELSAFAEGFGMTPNLEPMPWTDVRCLDEATLILRRCAGADVGVLVDAIHYDRALATPDDLRAMPGEWTRYVQICDAVLPRPTSIDELRHQGRNARLFPGEGSIDLVSMLRALPTVPASVEAPTEWNAPAGVRARAALRSARAVVARADESRPQLSA